MDEVSRHAFFAELKGIASHMGDGSLMKISMAAHTILAAGRKASRSAFGAQEAARKVVRKVPRPSASSPIGKIPSKAPRPMGAVSKKAPPIPGSLKPRKPRIDWGSGGGNYDFSGK